MKQIITHKTPKNSIVVEKLSTKDLGYGPAILKKVDCSFDAITMPCEQTPTELELHTFGSYICDNFTGNNVLVIYSGISQLNRLLLKTFRFNLPDVLQNHCTVVPVVWKSYVYFIGFIDLCNQDALYSATEFLYSGLVDSGYFILHSVANDDNVQEIVKNALHIIYDRHSNIKGVFAQIDEMLYNSHYIILCPYGGADMGCMIMYVVSSDK